MISIDVQLSVVMGLFSILSMQSEEKDHGLFHCHYAKRKSGMKGHFFLENRSSSLMAEEIYSNHLLSIFMQAELCRPLQ